MTRRAIAQDHRLGQRRDEASGREHQQSVQVPVPALQDADSTRTLSAAWRATYGTGCRTYGTRCRTLRQGLPYLRHQMPYPTARIAVPYGTSCRLTRKEHRIEHRNRTRKIEEWRRCPVSSLSLSLGLLISHWPIGSRSPLSQGPAVTPSPSTPDPLGDFGQTDLTNSVDRPDKLGQTDSATSVDRLRQLGRTDRVNSVDRLCRLGHTEFDHLQATLRLVRFAARENRMGMMSTH